MVKRFNCRPDDYDEFMFEEEGGQYVDAQDYDDVLLLLRTCTESMSDWAADAREELARVDDAVQEMFNALEDM